MTDAETRPEVLIRDARGGDAQALGRLLESYRDALRRAARALAGRGLRARLDPSDLVQETFLDAHRDFPRFGGRREPELLAWLRRILVRNLADQTRRHRASSRDYRREDAAEGRADVAGPPAGASPSEQASRREQVDLVAAALARLPGDYRRVIALRNLEHLPFEEVAARMGRSAGATRMLWARALERLDSELGGCHDHGR